MGAFDAMPRQPGGWPYRPPEDSAESPRGIGARPDSREVSRDRVTGRCVELSRVEIMRFAYFLSTRPPNQVHGSDRTFCP